MGTSRRRGDDFLPDPETDRMTCPEQPVKVIDSVAKSLFHYTAGIFSNINEYRLLACNPQFFDLEFIMLGCQSPVDELERLHPGIIPDFFYIAILPGTSFKRLAAPVTSRRYYVYCARSGGRENQTLFLSRNNTTADEKIDRERGADRYFCEAERSTFRETVEQGKSLLACSSDYRDNYLFFTGRKPEQKGREIPLDIFQLYYDQSRQTCIDFVREKCLYLETTDIQPASDAGDRHECQQCRDNKEEEIVAGIYSGKTEQ